MAGVKHDFDPDAPAGPGSGLFGLSPSPDEARVHVVPVPFDATTSYRQGAAKAPVAVLAASHQVDLFDLSVGRPWEAGIWLSPSDGRVERWNDEARALARPIIDAGGRIEGERALERGLERVNAIGSEVNAWVRERTEGVLSAGKLPVILGGDHSVPFGALEAAAARHPGLGILHFDAHADLRVAYEGFTWSHASIFWNVLERLAGVERLVQVGLRDLGEAEHERIVASEGRVRALFDVDWARARFEGRLRERVRETLALLPGEVWVSFDVDGLDPVLCPNTGTPVPGGFAWHEAMLWLEELSRCGSRVVGVDLCEVSPGPGGDPEGVGWDAAVGARLLYRLIGTALVAGGLPGAPGSAGAVDRSGRRRGGEKEKEGADPTGQSEV